MEVFLQILKTALKKWIIHHILLTWHQSITSVYKFEVASIPWTGFWPIMSSSTTSSVLCRCRWGDRKGIRPVKNWVVGCWRGYLSELDADLRMAKLIPLPFTVSFSSKSRLVILFWYQLTLVILDKVQRAIKRVCRFVLYRLVSVSIKCMV